MALAREITAMSASEIRTLLRDGSLSCEEVTRAFLERIEEINPTINAFCTVDADGAVAAAVEADRVLRCGRPIGSLHGLPIALKDLTPTRGIRTTRGSRLFESSVPDEDAVLVRRLRAAGAIVLGKTNTPEFGHKAVTDNLIFGPTRNPWNLERVAGGSSGGSAAAIAAGLAPLAEGSDGAGSIRIPASMCGVFGFKPTWGRVPDVAGPFSSHSPFFHNGPIARTVTDAALLYDAMAGPHPSDPFSLPAGESAAAGLEDGIAGARIAVSPDLGSFAVTPEVRSACERAAERFRALGCEVRSVDATLGDDLEWAFGAFWRSRLVASFGHLPDSEMELLEPTVRALIDDGRRMTAVELGRANAVRERAWARLSALFGENDLLLCPTTAVPAFPIAEGPPPTVDGRPVDPLLGWFLTYPFNLTGNPAASVPCGLSGEGLPIGLQVVGRRLEDALVLRACRAYERIAPWPRAGRIG